MKILFRLILLFCTIIFLSGCETTNSVPYKASTDNVIKIQQNLKEDGKKVQLGEFIFAEGTEENLLCRLMGPVKVAPGKTLPQYIKEAFQEELFLAQAYSTDAPTIITGTIDAISFSSVSPANWDITLSVKSNQYSGYQVNTKYNFDTSWSAYSACENVADAFAPAVQSLINEIITHPEFNNLIQN